MPVDRKHRINREYKIHEQIGSGAFGEVYRVTSRDGTNRAAKFVKKTYKALLQQESDVMQPMTGRRQYGTIYKYYFGRHHNHYVLVMDLLGRSIWDLYRSYHGLSLKTVLMLGIQMTYRVWELHDRGCIHRDIKPDNFVVGRRLPDSRYVYLIDYGLAQSYVDSSNRHKSKSLGHGFVGTPTFASKHSHRGERQSRRSDLESVVYTLIFLFRGKLPWNGACQSKARKIKESIAASELCSRVPDAIAHYYRAVRSLGFSERPDYKKLIAYLESAMRMYGYALDYRFEWT